MGECLDSLLAQTFTNFEVIVVDDCSTDNSVAVAESYVEKFGGRMTLLHMEENMGNGGVCRNKGFLVSRGEYIQFLDSDDVLTKTALEELYTLAKDYDAEVVYCEKHLESKGVGEDLFKNAVIDTSLTIKPPYVDKPTFESEDLSERVEKLLHGRFGVVCWDKFIRRDFMQENELFFPHVRRSEDTIWSRGVVFCAKKILRVPNTVYIYRKSIASVTRGKKTPEDKMTLWVSPTLLGLKALDNFMSKHEFFRLNPSYRYIILKNFGLMRLNHAVNFGKNLSEEAVYSIIKEEFGKKLGEYDVLISLLLANLCSKEKSYDDVQEFIKLAANFIARIDIKFLSTTGDFQIIKVSDEKATVWKPAWFQKGGIGYQIQSHIGNLEIVAKATTDGKVQLKLRGVDVQDNSKRLPYWIDYTKLIVNGKAIFDKLTSAWHDKPFQHNINVKADEEIEIQVECLPHRNN